MTATPLPKAQFDRIITLQEQAFHSANVESDMAFCAALTLAIKKRKEHAVPGTFVDLTPPINAYRYHGHLRRSPCGSPSALCSEFGALGNGTATLR